MPASAHEVLAEAAELIAAVTVALQDGRVSAAEALALGAQVVKLVHALPGIPPRRQRLVNRIKRLRRQIGEKRREIEKLEGKLAELD